MMRFEEVVQECLKDKDFVLEFDRLMGASIGGRPRSPLVLLVDQATGYDELKTRADYKKFVAFVYEVVWTRLPEDARDPSETVAPPPGESIQELLGNAP